MATCYTILIQFLEVWQLSTSWVPGPRMPPFPSARAPTLGSGAESQSLALRKKTFLEPPTRWCPNSSHWFRNCCNTSNFTRLYITVDISWVYIMIYTGIYPRTTGGNTSQRHSVILCSTMSSTTQTHRYGVLLCCDTTHLWSNCGRLWSCFTRIRFVEKGYPKSEPGLSC